MTAITSAFRKARALGLDLKLETNHSAHGGIDLVVWDRKDPSGDRWSTVCKDGLGDVEVGRIINKGIEAMRKDAK